MQFRRLCCCDARFDAQMAGEFIFLPGRQAWVFTHGPSRTMSAKARYFAFIERSEFAHPDTEGHPFLFVDCPFCGCDLPHTPPTSLVLPQADGEGAE